MVSKTIPHGKKKESEKQKKLIALKCPKNRSDSFLIVRARTRGKTILWAFWSKQKGIGFFCILKRDWFLCVENLFCGILHFFLVWNVESDRILIVSQTTNQPNLPCQTYSPQQMPNSKREAKKDLPPMAYPLHPITSLEKTSAHTQAKDAPLLV
jgi:hypothetical protein